MADFQSAYLTWDNGGFLEFSIVNEHHHEGEVIITEHPVEEGADVADNVRQQLDKFSCTAFISNAPITGPGGVMGSVPIIPPVYSPPFLPTPGAVFGAIGGAISSLFSDPKPAAANVLLFADPKNYVSQGLVTLRSLQADGQILKIVTPELDYSNMILESFSMTRNAETGTGATVELSFKQIRFVSSKQGFAPAPTEVRAAPVVAKGIQGPKEAPPAKQDSLAKRIFG